MDKAVGAGLLFAVAGAALGCVGCVIEAVPTAGAAFAVGAPPPPPVREAPPPPPAPQAVWIAGYWHWTGLQYTWIPGHWEFAQAGAAWRAPHYWVREGVYYYEPGGWVRR
jgi:hypothetical protein